MMQLNLEMLFCYTLRLNAKRIGYFLTFSLNKSEGHNLVEKLSKVTTSTNNLTLSVE
jgi:hypothetical protein